MSQTPPQPAGKVRPGSVTLAVWLQILLAVFLLAQTVVSFVYGPAAGDAAADALEAQGVAASDLPEGTSFEPGAGALAFNVVLAVGLCILAALNGAGKRPARIITWIVQPIMLVCTLAGLASTLFMTQFLTYMFESSGDPTLETLDVEAIVDAVTGAYPAWTAVLSWGALALGLLGSLLVIILLAVPSANAFFRKEEPEKYIPGAPEA
jgi:fumarate reductase subunit C